MEKKAGDPRLKKALIRKKILNLLKKFPDRVRKRKSKRIFQRLIRDRRFQRARNIFTYVSLKREVDTRALIAFALSQGKKVFVPCVRKRDKSVTLYRIKDPSRDLKKGAYNIWEPRPNRCPRGRLRDLNLMIIPGLAFDFRGYRLGRGGGYFDRFLAQAKGITRIGLAFKEQCLKAKLPVEAHDVRIHTVIHD